MFQCFFAFEFNEKYLKYDYLYKDAQFENLFRNQKDENSYLETLFNSIKMLNWIIMYWACSA